MLELNKTLMVICNFSTEQMSYRAIIVVASSLALATAHPSCFAVLPSLDQSLDQTLDQFIHSFDRSHCPDQLCYSTSSILSLDLSTTMSSTHPSSSSSSSSSVPPPPSSSTSMSDYRTREAHLRRLDAELTNQQSAVVARADALVAQQSAKLDQMKANGASSMMPTPSHPNESFDAFHVYRGVDQQNNGFLEETSGFRGRIESTTGASNAPTRASRPTSAAIDRRSSNNAISVPLPSSSSSSSSNSRIGSASSSNARIPSSSSSSNPPPLSSPSFAEAAAAATSSRPSSRVASRSTQRSAQAPSSSSSSSLQHPDSAASPVDDAPVDADDLPDGIDAAMGPAATIRFQKARITALSSSLATIQSTLAARDAECDAMKLQLRGGSDARDKMQRLKETSERASITSAKALGDALAKVAALESASAQYRRDGGVTDKRSKEMEQEGKAKDAKINRIEAEMQRMRDNAGKIKGGGGAGGGATSGDDNKDISALRIMNKKLLQQRMELLTGLKKQTRLIEILKKQKLHMELAKMLQFTEDEFAKSLEMGDI